MTLALVSPFPEPETHIFVMGLYVILGALSAYQLYRLARVIVTPLERTQVPPNYVPRYPEDLGVIECTVGRGAKALKIIVLTVSALICMGGMYVALAAGYRREYIEFVGWSSVSHNLLLAAHALWPVALWVLALVRAKPKAVNAA